MHLHVGDFHKLATAWKSSAVNQYHYQSLLTKNLILIVAVKALCCRPFLVTTLSS